MGPMAGLCQAGVGADGPGELSWSIGPGKASQAWWWPWGTGSSSLKQTLWQKPWLSVMALWPKKAFRRNLSALSRILPAHFPVAVDSLYPVPTAQAVGSQPACQPWRAWLLLQSHWERVLSCHYFCFMDALQVLLVQITFSVYVLCMKQTCGVLVCRAVVQS